MSAAIGEKPTITIEGVDYTVRRLNVADVFTVGRILGYAIARGGRELEAEFSTGNMGAQRVGMLFMSCIPFAEDDCMKLLSSLISVSPQTFANFPPEAMIDLVAVVAESQDLKAFLDRCVSVFQTMKAPTPIAAAKKNGRKAT